MRGIPDESSVPSLFMNYQSVYTVSPRSGATGTWKLDGQLIPNPLSFGAVVQTDSVGTALTEFVNTQIPGDSHPQRLSEFLKEFTRWRLAYASVTIYQDGPDLANQGTIVVCQKPVKPVVTHPVPMPMVASGYRPSFTLNASDLPNYEASQAMPNAYFGKSREGAYIPLKLTRTCQKWHSASDLVYQATASAIIDYDDGVAGGRADIPSVAQEEVLGQYPFASVNDLHYNPEISTLCGSLTSNFCNDNWADFSFRNLSVQSSVSMFFRFGFECQLQPTSALSPHLKLSPPSDPLAISKYFAVSRELKDAYPADHNDLGKIWDVISSIVKTVGPALSVIPVAGPILATALPAAAAFGDRIRQAAQRSKRSTQGNTASQSDIELLRNVVKTRPLPLIRRKRPRVKTATVMLRRRS